ncbi:MAG: orotate phosphoribosyltransferase [Pseudomonadota bacterium]
MAISKDQLIRLFLDEDVLRFGDFTLKSGRRSPYFFNLGALCTGPALATLAAAYADRIEAAAQTPSVLFGPAYKGIPLAAAVGTELARRGIATGIAFNRKERKDHGEGGALVGASLDGAQVLILDDVLTAGTALREAVALIQGAGGTVAGVLIAMDRQERAPGAAGSEGTSAVDALAAEVGAGVESLITLSDLVRYLDANPAEGDGVLESKRAGDADLRGRMMEYQKLHCTLSL